MDSNSFLNYQHHQRHPNSGLLRFRSAPTSLLNDFTQSLSSDLSKANNPWEGPESDKLVSRFVSAHELDSSAFPEFEAKAPNKVLTDPMNLCNNNNNNNGLPPHYPRQNSTSSSAMDSSYRLVEPLGMDPQTPVKTFNTNLLRQSSSPAGLFSNTSFPNGYSTVKGVFNYGGGVNGSNGGGSPSMSRLKNQHGMLSRSNSSLGVLSQISEVEGESTEATNPDNGYLPSVNGYVPAFPYNTSWNDASHLSESLGGLKREPSNSEHLFSIAQNGALGNRVHMLSHHLSLPKPMADMGAMEKFLQFPDSVPCKIRAKRGCATHPRSIAERVRRTRISERMRKLQELVPNMDKQTNTSDMLDLAVEYIKDLQNQFKILNEKRAKCKCMSTQ